MDGFKPKPGCLRQEPTTGSSLMKGSTLTAALVMVRRTADWLRSRHRHPSLGREGAMGATASEGAGVCTICGETRTTERVYQSGSVMYTMKHFVCKHPKVEKL